MMVKCDREYASYKKEICERIEKCIRRSDAITVKARAFVHLRRKVALVKSLH